jgi:signal transduction histidine kinase
MWATDSSRVKALLGGAWLLFGGVNTWLMFVLPGEETIPYHLTWASFALLYGLIVWSRATTWIVFASITVGTGIPLIRHARSGVIGWEECSEIVLMGVIVALLVWHVDRHRTIQERLTQLRERERRQAHEREVTTRFGSHQIRTRLTIARGFAELVRDAAQDDTTREDASLIVSELDKASALTTQLLTLVQIGGPSPLELIDFDDLIDTLVHRWRTSVQRHWTCRSSAGLLLGDAERLESALDCLIENATKFTVESDRIEVLAYVDQGSLWLSVRDTGAGIPPEDLARITGVFETGSTAGERAGSGLGLAIVEAIVNTRCGDLRITSEVGVGTRVDLRVPAHRPQSLARTTGGHDAPKLARTDAEPTDPISLTATR